MEQLISVYPLVFDNIVFLDIFMENGDQWGPMEFSMLVHGVSTPAHGVFHAGPLRSMNRQAQQQYNNNNITDLSSAATAASWISMD